VYRWRFSGHVTNAYRDRYMETFEKRRPGFDFTRYFTTFHLQKLLRSPNRRLGGGSTSIYANNPDANSFFTLLYSEVWGDHWLYFSGNPTREGKLWPKRTMLTVALAMPAVLVTLGGGFIADLIGRVRRALAELKEQKSLAKLGGLIEKLEVELVLCGIAGLGCALYLYWQLGPALLPGKNSTIKFVYIASLFGPALALLFRRRPSARAFNLLAVYFLILFVVAVPVAMFWPM
jgi:hypothetical protein